MSEKLLNEQIVGQIQDVFANLKDPVQVLFFGNERDCEYCDDTRQLVEEVTAISDKLHLDIYDIERDAEMAKKYRVDKTPGIVIAGRKDEQIHDYGIRYAGIPSGHEFSSLIHDLVTVSNGDSGLSQETRNYLKTLDKPVLLQVFVTPT